MNNKAFHLERLVLLIVIIAGACFAAQFAFTGKIAAIGHVPFVETLVVNDSGEKYVLGKNEIALELKHLQGATVKIFGTRTGKTTIYGPELMPTYYQIQWIGEGKNRQRPWTGLIRIKQNQVFLEEPKGKRFELEGPAALELTKFPGAKVWVTGSLHRKRFWGKAVITTGTFGIIRNN